MKSEVENDKPASGPPYRERGGFKFLIIRFSSIGDIVLTTPVIRCLKKQVANAEVHFLTKASFGTIVENNPFIDKVHLLAHSWDTVLHELKQENYDYIIDLHHNLRTLRLKKDLGIRSFPFHKLNIQKWIYTNFKWNMMPDLHIVDRYMKTVESFGVVNDGEGLDYFIPEKDAVKQRDIPASHHAGYIGLVIGAAHYTKKLPVDKLKELCGKIDHPIILLGGKEDNENGKQIASVDQVKVYNACGKFNLNESADLVRRSKLIISHDTGLMHVAAAFKKKVISVWGNTVPEFGRYPYYGKFEISNFKFEIRNLQCRPCSKIGYSKCPRGHFKCMKQISIDAIAETARQYL
ncbi:MAG TPA: glycosyltransferase family 9 protein, partial [Chitinophagaceae bacterium]|nr:glycosyltransferase family 9 protein [Chitinophagaceae bacterium]